MRILHWGRQPMKPQSMADGSMFMAPLPAGQPHKIANLKRGEGTLNATRLFIKRNALIRPTAHALIRFVKSTKPRAESGNVPRLLIGKHNRPLPWKSSSHIYWVSATLSAPARDARSCHVLRSMSSNTNVTLPSPFAAMTPPECSLRAAAH